MHSGNAYTRADAYPPVFCIVVRGGDILCSIRGVTLPVRFAEIIRKGIQQYVREIRNGL